MSDRVTSIRDNAAVLAMADPDEIEASLEREELIDLEVAVRRAARKIRDRRESGVVHRDALDPGHRNPYREGLFWAFCTCGEKFSGGDPQEAESNLSDHWEAVDPAYSIPQHAGSQHRTANTEEAS